MASGKFNIKVERTEFLSKEQLYALLACEESLDHTYLYGESHGLIEGKENDGGPFFTAKHTRMELMDAFFNSAVRSAIHYANNTNVAE